MMKLGQMPTAKGCAPSPACGEGWGGVSPRMIVLRGPHPHRIVRCGSRNFASAFLNGRRRRLYAPASGRGAASLPPTDPPKFMTQTTPIPHDGGRYFEGPRWRRPAVVPSLPGTDALSLRLG
jgi:hypothetical protein